MPDSLFGDATHRICGVAAASTAQEMRLLVRQALRLTRTVELRLDWLRNDQEREKFLHWLKRTIGLHWMNYLQRKSGACRSNWLLFVKISTLLTRNWTGVLLPLPPGWKKPAPPRTR